MTAARRRPATPRRGDGETVPDRARFRRATRAVSPVVGKTLEIGLVVLFVSTLTATLFGGAVPAYEAAVGDELADRTLAMAATEVEAAVPSSAEGTVTALNRTVEVSLPPTIDGRVYHVRATDDASLVLDHPHPNIGAETRLALPSDADVAGEWAGDAEAVVAVEQTPSGLRIRLEDRR